MSEEWLRSAAYRKELADEARTKADEMRDNGAKKTMLGIASSYDRLAAQAAERESGSSKPK